MATLTKQSIVRAGLEPVLSSCAGGGDEFANSGNEFIEVVNGDASDHTVTIAIQQTVDGQSVTARDVVITASERRFIGPFDTDIYNDSGGKVQLTYDAVTSMTIGVFR